MEKAESLDVFIEMACIDFELETLLESHPEIARGHEEDLRDLGLAAYIRSQIAEDGREKARNKGAGALDHG